VEDLGGFGGRKGFAQGTDVYEEETEFAFFGRG
jgi:hypothetical protein